MTTRKIVLKKVKVGTPIKTVTAGSFGINNLGGVNTTGRTTGSLLAFNQSSGNFEPVTLTGDSNHFLTFDSSGTPDTLQINFTNDSISGSLIPKLDSAFDLGSSTKKWKDLFLSGSTITLGDLTIQSTGGGIEVKDSDGNTLLQNIKYITVNGDTDILAYDSNTSTFTFNDSDIARTDEIETFHKAIKVTDSAEITSNLTVGGNLTVVGDLQYDDVSADSAVFSGSVAIGNNLTADSSTINKIANTTLTGQNATFDSATIGNLAVTNLVISSGDSAFFSKVGVGDLEVDSANIDRLTLDSGQVRQLSTGFINADSAFMDSATISTIATGTINADQQFTDSATITNIANSVLTAKVITNTTLVGDSATIGNIASSQLTIDNATFDSSAHNTLHANALTVDSGDIRQLSVDFINADSAFLDSATITNLSTTQITLSQMTLDSATVNNLNVDSSDIRQVSTEFINFDSAFGDSATITNIANTQLTGSQATLDSATITKLNVDSSDIDHLSTEAINFDSATGDSATITNIANSVLTAKAITGTSADIDSATIGNIAITNAVISSGDSATITNIANSVLTAKAITGTSADIDSATIGNIAATTINVDNINIGDSATFTNLATTQLTGSQATFDSATITTLNIDSADIDHFSTENINFDSATGDSATITSVATTTLTAGTITATTFSTFSGGLQTAGMNVTSGNVSLVDNSLLKLGTADDLQIYHDASNSYVRHVGTGNLNISGDEVRILNQANDELKALFTTNGSVELYFDNTKRFETKDSGVAITGTLSVDSATLTNLTGDSATITNIASTQFTGSQVTIDSADIGNLRVTGITNLDSTSATVIDFDNNILDSSPYQEGRVWYDKKFKSLAYYSDDSNVVHEVGLEEHQKVYNNSGATILKGKPLYFSGNYTAGDVDVPTVGLADATDENAYNAQGLAAADIPNGAYGYCIISGQLSGVDTSALSANTNFFVGLGPGLVQNASPLYPNYPMCLGWVVSSATDGILLVNQQNHSVSSFRVRTSAHVGTNLQVDGDLTVLGSTTSVSSADLTAGTPMFRLNEGNAIGEAGTTFTGTGLDDAFYSGFFTGTANQNYYVRIDGVGTGAGGVDTFEVAFADDSTFSSPVLTKQPITGSAQMIHSTDNISINFASTTGHDSGDRWSGTAGPINVDTGFFSNRNTGSSGIGFTYVGIYYDVSDNKWKLIDEYDSSPSGAINEDDSSYSKGILVLDTLEGNVTGNLTGTVQTANQPNITAVGTLTSLAVANGFSADSGDIRQLSTDFINTDSAFMDSATITNLASTQFTGSQATIDSADIRILTGDSAVFSSAIQTPKITTPNFTFDSDRFAVGGTGTLNFFSGGNFRMGINKSANIGSEGVLSTHALAVKGDAYFLDRSAGFSIELIPDTDPVVFRANNRTGSAFAGIDFKVANGNPSLDQTVMKLNTTGMELKGDLSRTSGDMTFDMPANIILDADGGVIKLSDGGTQFAELTNSSSDFVVESKVQDKDIIFKGDDGGSGITALTLDMSEAGKATFNDAVIAPKADIDSADIRQLTTEFIHGDSAVFDSATITTLAVGTLNIDNINIGDSATFTNVAVTTELNTNKLIVDDLTIDGSSIADAGDFTLNIEGDITLDANGADIKLSDDGLHFGTLSRSVNDLVIKPPIQDGDLVIKGNDGGSEITALTLDMSEAGAATFSGDIITSGTIRAGNLNVDSADIITIARSNISGRNGLAYNSSTGVFDLDSANAITTVKNALSTGHAGLTYDSAAGQFGLNANHVMALIQTVDSNGSGLNADTLEGQAGIYYRINVYNASGTLLN